MAYLNKGESSLLPAFIVGSVLLQGVLFLVVIITFGKIDSIASSKTPNLVELIDGTTARVKTLPHNQRSPYVISRFVSQTMFTLMSWNATSNLLSSSNKTDGENLDPVAKGQLDEGVQIGDKKITTATWQAGFSLSEDFRNAFLTQIASLTPQEVFSGKTQSLLIVRYVSNPQQMKEGQWKLDLVASLVIFEDGRGNSKALPFNKTIFVRSIDTPPLPKNATDLQITAYKARQDGLEIYRIQDLAEK